MSEQTEQEVKEEQAKQAKQSEQGAEAGEPKRKVVVSARVKVVFDRKSGGESESVVVPRDLFSVIDAIGSRIEATKDKPEFDDLLVSVHSTEDESKSDPLKEGDIRWEGQYQVGGVVVERLPIKDAMNELAKGIIPNDAAMGSVERLAEQLFLRSRMDGFVFIGTFDGSPAVVPLISSFRGSDNKAKCFAELYKQMHVQAENLKAWVSRTFPDMKVEWPGQRERPSGLVLPSGAPIEGGAPVRISVPGCRARGGCQSGRK